MAAKKKSAVKSATTSKASAPKAAVKTKVAPKASGAKTSGPKTAAPKTSAAKATKGAVKKTAAPKKASAVKHAAAPKKAGGVKKASAPKLNDKQLEILKKVHGAGEGGYEVDKTELRTIEALKTRKCVKAGAKEKGTGRVRYTVTKDGLKHVSASPSAGGDAAKS